MHTTYACQSLLDLLPHFRSPVSMHGCPAALLLTVQSHDGRLCTSAQVLEAETAGTKEQLERAIARAAAAEEEVAQMRAALADLHVRP